MSASGTTSLINIMVLLSTFATIKGTSLEQQTGITDGRRGVLNSLLHEYVSAFEDLRQGPDFKDYADSMKTIKALIIQSWIYTLVPETSLLQKVMTVGESEDLKTVKERIVQDMKEKEKKSSVSDDILTYVKNVKPKVKEAFSKRAKIISSEIDAINEKWNKIMDRRQGPVHDPVWEQKEYDLKMAVLSTGFVNTATRMALQSYVLDLMDQEGRGHDTSQVQSSDGQMMELDTPPLNRDSFEEIQLEEE